MHSRTTQLPEAPTWRHIHAILDIGVEEATLTIVESTAADVDTIDGAVLADDWGEQESAASRWTAGTIPVHAHAAAILAERLAERVAALPPGPARRRLQRELVAQTMLAIAMDGAT